ncbi:MAG: hypothetical protein WCK53_12215 [Methanomicrobiales archaeon]
MLPHDRKLRRIKLQRSTGNVLLTVHGENVTAHNRVLDVDQTPHQDGNGSEELCSPLHVQIISMQSSAVRCADPRV